MAKTNYLALVCKSAALILLGCQSVDQKLDPKVNYRLDTVITYNKQDYVGVAVLPKATSYNLKIKSPGKMDLITITSCYSEFTDEKAGKSGFFSDETTYEYTYVPNQNFESKKMCPLEVNIYEAVQGRNSWGRIYFASDYYTLGYTINCNGSAVVSSGIAACQSREGLIQQIRFFEPVKAGNTLPCPKLETKDNMIFEFPIPKGECNYYFMNKSGSTGMLATIGYEQVPIRKATQ